MIEGDILEKVYTRIKVFGTICLNDMLNRLYTLGWSKNEDLLPIEKRKVQRGIEL